MMDKNVWLAWALATIANIVCWTVLAIHFGKWWIALGTLLVSFKASTKNNTGEGNG